MSRKFLTGSSWLLAALFGASATAATACLPPPPGWVEPTREERVRNAARFASQVVYGEIIGVGRDGRHIRLRVQHVYKGSARAGSILSMRIGWGLDAPPCAGIIGGPPPIPNSSRGERVAAMVFPGSDELSFLADGDLRLMLRLELFRPGPHDLGDVQAR